MDPQKDAISKKNQFNYLDIPQKNSHFVFVDELSVDDEHLVPKLSSWVIFHQSMI